MKINNRFIFGIVSIALAAVIAFIAIPTISRQTNGKTEIVRVVQPIQKGSVITSQDIEIIEVGEYNLPQNIAKTEEDVIGKYTTADLSAGDYILSSKVSFTPISSDLQLNSIPSGKVAISITVKTLSSGLSDKLQTGDVVRIYHFLNGVIEIPELQFVKVLMVTDSKGVNVDYGQELQEDEEKRQSATITVLCSPEQAKIITGLDHDGIAHVALICRGNETLAEELLETQDAILREMYSPDDENAVSGNPSENTITPDTDVEDVPSNEQGDIG